MVLDYLRKFKTLLQLYHIYFLYLRYLPSILQLYQTKSQRMNYTLLLFYTIIEKNIIPEQHKDKMWQL